MGERVDIGGTTLWYMRSLSRSHVFRRDWTTSDRLWKDLYQTQNGGIIDGKYLDVVKYGFGNERSTGEVVALLGQNLRFCEASNFVAVLILVAVVCCFPILSRCFKMQLLRINMRQPFLTAEISH